MDENLSGLNLNPWRASLEGDFTRLLKQAQDTEVEDPTADIVDIVLSYEAALELKYEMHNWNN